MKAVEEIKSNPDLPVWITGDAENPKSYWYLDRGVKIEWFPDGTVKVWNVMSPGHNYQPIIGIDYEYFEKFGWKAGLYRFNWKYFEDLAKNTKSRERMYEHWTRSEQYKKYFIELIAQENIKL